MTFSTILSRLRSLGLPVAHMEFKVSKKHPAPEPPFIIYLRSDHARGSDGLNNLLEIKAGIELYTDGLYTDDNIEALAARIESEVLFDIEYQRNQAPIPDENMIQTAYDFSILEKRRKDHG